MKDRRRFKTTWGGCIVSLQVSDTVLEKAMKEAVSQGLLPKNAPSKDHLLNWLRMQAVLEAAIEQAVDEAHWREEVL